MTVRLTRLGAVMLLVVAAMTACQAATSVVDSGQLAVSAQPAPTVTPDRVVSPTAEAEAEPGVESLVGLSPDLLTPIENLAEGYRAAATVWVGFAPNAHPVVLAVKSRSDELTGALAVNHPAPDALGDAIPLDTTGTPFVSLHLVRSLNGEAAIALEAVNSFELSALVGGVDTFLMAAGGSDPFFDPTTTRYVSTLLHEMFHRHQAQTFSDVFVSQDIDGYDYSAAHLELIALEDRALSAAVVADNGETRRRAIGHVVAIRRSRLAADSRVSLDAIQELREGTARFIEHQLGGSDTGYDYHTGNFDQGLLVDIPDINVKGNLAFGRWYVTGAAAMHLLEELEVPDVEKRLEGGETPMSILAETVENDASETERLVEEARATYDPTNELGEQAARAAGAVTEEAPFWDGEGLVESEPAAVEISADLVACLESRGADFTAQRVDVSQEDWDACATQDDE